MNFELIRCLAMILACIDCDNVTNTGKFDANFDHWACMIEEFIFYHGDLARLTRIVNDARVTNDAYLRCNETYNRIFYSNAKHNRKLSKARILYVRQEYWCKREEMLEKARNMILDIICE